MKKKSDSAKKQRSAFQNAAFLLYHSWKWDKILFLMVFVHTLLSAFAPFIGIFFPKFIIDELTGAKRPEVIIGLVIGFFVISAIVKFFIEYLGEAYYPRLTIIRFRFAEQGYQKCLLMDFKKTEDPEILNQVEIAFRAVDSNNSGLEMMLRKVLYLSAQMLSIVGYISIILTLNPLLMILLVINVIITYGFFYHARKYEHSRQEEAAEYDRKSGYLYDAMYNFQYGKDTRLFSAAAWLGEKYNIERRKRFSVQKDVIKRHSLSCGVDVVVTLIREGAVYAYLIYRMIAKGMTIGDFSMYLSTVTNFANGMWDTMNSLVEINTQNLYVNDFRNFLEMKNDPQEEDLIPIPKADTYEIEFRNVSFRYPRSENYVYRNLSLKIKEGQKLAIVGINGAGKTTFVKLLTRLYEPTDGQILLNGIDIRRFDREEYYRLFSVVFQEIYTLAFSVAENVAVDEYDSVDLARVEDSLKRADLWEKIQNLPKQLLTSVQKNLDPEGIQLSGGENQKLALARALYKNGGVIVLDEPTSALDPIAEYRTYMTFNEMIGNKTAIYISHRLASTRFCDVIAFFEDGCIKEYGTHEELLANGKGYAEMFETQAQYYKEDAEVNLNEVTASI